MHDGIKTTWQHDQLDRKGLANFLYRHVVERSQMKFAADRHEAFCFALDGDWGTGKSFFVTEWAEDIRNCSHPVVKFDAWKNDLSDDPLLGFLAVVREEFRALAKNLPVGGRVAQSIEAELKTFIRKSCRAIVPASGAILRGLVKRGIGVGIDEIQDAISDASNVSEDTIPKDGPTIVSAAVDSWLDTTLDGHVQRIRAVDEMRNSLESMLELLHKSAKVQLPMFIFIDELDRCRPDYAVSLLEAVKHLFNCRGVCFVVSTNLAQLSQSIKAVYGSGFDSYRYLKRLFAFEYSLPPPNNLVYAKSLTSSSFMLGFKELVSGLPSETESKSNDEKIAQSFSVVASGFRLDLRSQQQVLRIAESAASGLELSSPIHLMLLFSLSAVCHLNPSILDLANTYSSIPSAWWKQIDPLVDRRVTIEFQVQRQIQFGRLGFVTEELRFADMLEKYCEWIHKDLKELRDSAFGNNTDNSYPNFVLRRLAQEMPSTFYPDKPYPPIIASYPELVRYAGQRLNALRG